MEASPTDIDVSELYNKIARLNTVEEIHDFHCWTLGGGKHVMSCHIRSQFSDRVLHDINRICKHKNFGIYHTTIQVEREKRHAQAISCDHC